MVKYECLCLHVRHTHFAPVPDAGRANQSCTTQQNQSNAGVAVGSQHTRVSEKSIVRSRKFPIPQNAQAMSRSGDDCGSERRRRSRMAINDRASRLLLHLVVHAISRSCSACPKTVEPSTQARNAVSTERAEKDYSLALLLTSTCHAPGNGAFPENTEPRDSLMVLGLRIAAEPERRFRVRDDSTPEPIPVLA